MYFASSKSNDLLVFLQQLYADKSLMCYNNIVTK